MQLKVLYCTTLQFTVLYISTLHFTLLLLQLLQVIVYFYYTVEGNIVLQCIYLKRFYIKDMIFYKIHCYRLNQF